MRLAIATITLMSGIAAVATWLPMGASKNGLATVSKVKRDGVAQLTETAEQQFDRHHTYRVFALPHFVNDSPTAEPARASPQTATTTRTSAQPGQDRAASPSVPPPANVSPSQLVFALQRELRRVGCYSGAIDGIWGPGSRAGMRAFAEQRNVQLDVGNPDLVALTVLRGHPGLACPVTCAPADRSPRTGRCLRGPMLARVIPQRSSPAWQTNKVTVTTPNTEQSTVAATGSSVVPVGPGAAPMEGRMAMGRPGSQGSDATSRPVVSTRSTAKRRRSYRPRRTVRRRPTQDWTSVFFNN